MKTPRLSPLVHSGLRSLAAAGALLLLTTPLPSRAAATISGSEADVRLLLEAPVETVHLAASATANLQPTAAVIQASIEVEGRTFAELLKMTADKKDAIRAALPGLTPEFSDTYDDLPSAIEIAKLKRLSLRTDFKVRVTDLTKADDAFAAIAALASVTINDMDTEFEAEPELGARLLDAAVQDLQRQKAFYESTFGIELRLKAFLPFTAKENGGGLEANDEEVVVLSPFEVSSRRSFGFRRKGRAEEVVVQKTFQSHQVVKQLSAVYEIHVRRAPSSGTAE